MMTPAHGVGESPPRLERAELSSASCNTCSAWCGGCSSNCCSSGFTLLAPSTTPSAQRAAPACVSSTRERGDARVRGGRENTISSNPPTPSPSPPRRRASPGCPDRRRVRRVPVHRGGSIPHQLWFSGTPCTSGTPPPPARSTATCAISGGHLLTTAPAPPMLMRPKLGEHQASTGFRRGYRCGRRVPLAVLVDVLGSARARRGERRSAETSLFYAVPAVFHHEPVVFIVPSFREPGHRREGDVGGGELTVLVVLGVEPLGVGGIELVLGAGRTDRELHLPSPGRSQTPPRRWPRGGTASSHASAPAVGHTEHASLLLDGEGDGAPAGESHAVFSALSSTDIRIVLAAAAKLSRGSGTRADDHCRRNRGRGAPCGGGSCRRRPGSAVLRSTRRWIGRGFIDWARRGRGSRRGRGTTPWSKDPPGAFSAAEASPRREARRRSARGPRRARDRRERRERRRTSHRRDETRERGGRESRGRPARRAGGRRRRRAGNEQGEGSRSAHDTAQKCARGSARSDLTVRGTSSGNANDARRWRRSRPVRTRDGIFGCEIHPTWHPAPVSYGATFGAGSACGAHFRAETTSKCQRRPSRASSWRLARPSPGRARARRSVAGAPISRRAHSNADDGSSSAHRRGGAASRTGRGAARRLLRRRERDPLRIQARGVRAPLGVETRFIVIADAAIRERAAVAI